MQQLILVVIAILMGLHHRLPTAEAQPVDVGQPEKAVDAGRRALDRWRPYPWYDRETDRLRLSVPADVRWTMKVARQIGWLGIGLLLAALAFFMLRAALHRQPAGPEQRNEKRRFARSTFEKNIEALPASVRGNIRDLLREARQFYHQEDYSRAIVCLFSYQLIQLDKNQLIHLAPGKTNRAYIHELRGLEPLQRLVADTMIAFEEVFFGNRPLQRNRFDQCWGRLDTFHGLLSQPRRQDE